MNRYQALTVASVAGALLLVALGSAVRTTGSGLGCPDWPLCYGGVLPPLEREAIFEWSHRTVAAVVGVLIVVQSAWTLMRFRSDRVQSALAVAVLPLLAVQAYLGRWAVLDELPEGVVAAHMLLALTLVSLLALMAAYAFLGPNRRWIEAPDYRGFRRLAMLTAAVMAGVMAVGAYSVATHAGFACSGWPGCPEAPVPFVDGARLHDIHWLHRFTVIAGLVAVLGLAYDVREMREARTWLSHATMTLAGLYVAQIIVGAGNIWSDFSVIVRVAHLAFGASLLGLSVVIVAAGPFEVAGRATARAKGRRRPRPGAAVGRSRAGRPDPGGRPA